MTKRNNEKKKMFDGWAMKKWELQRINTIRKLNILLYKIHWQNLIN